MKKIFKFAKKKRGASPSASETGSLTSAAGYELRDRDLSKLHRAACAGDLAKLRQLCRKQDPNQLDKERRTPLHLACANGHPELVSCLIENKSKLNLCDNDSRSPLMKAIQCQQERCATILLEYDADTNLVDINGNTALHFSALIPSVSLATQLLDHDAHIDAQNKDGSTPLLLAVTENHDDMVEFLLKQGADINAKDKSKRTPLMIAAGNGQISLVKLLVQNDVDVTIKDDKGCTADDYAVMNGHHACSHLIIEHGSKQKFKTTPAYHGNNKVKGVSMFSSPERAIDGFPLGGPAADRDEIQQSPMQTTRTRDSGKVTEDTSQVESESRDSNKARSIDSWTSSDEDVEPDFTPKKSKKPSLTELMNASMQTKKAVHDATSIIKMQPLASAQDSKSVSEEDLYHDSDDEEPRSRSPPKPLSRAPSFPHPAFVSPGSLPPPIQMASSPPLGFKQDDTEEDSRDLRENPAMPSMYLEDTEPPANDTASNLGSTAGRKVLMSELGLEDDDAESAWDSESASESPRKQTTPLPAANTQMQSISEEKSEDDSIKPTVQKPMTLLASFDTDTQVVSKPTFTESVKRQKSDLMEEFGLDDADDIEGNANLKRVIRALHIAIQERADRPRDASDWDSTSASPKQGKGFAVLHTDETATKELPLILTSKRKQIALPDAAGNGFPTIPAPAECKTDITTDFSRSRSEYIPESNMHALKTHRIPLDPKPAGEEGIGSTEPPLEQLSSKDMPVNNVNENSQQKDKHLLEVLKFPENTSSRNQLQKDTSPNRELGIEENENSQEDESSSDSDSPWEERYERMWVDHEKIEVKSHFKTVTAELKQKFGEIIENPKMLPSTKGSRDIFHQECNMTSGVQSNITSDGSSAEDNHKIANVTVGENQVSTQQSDLTMLDNGSNKSHPSDPNPPDLSRVQTSSNISTSAIGDSFNSSGRISTPQNQITCSNTLTQKQRNNTKLPKTSEMYERVLDRVAGLKNAENSKNHSFMEDCVHKSVNNSETTGLVSLNKRTQFSITVNNATEIKKLECLKNFNTQDLVDSNVGKFKLGSVVENRATHGSSEEATDILLDKGLEQDVQRFKNEVEEEKLKSTQSQKWDEMEKLPARNDGDNHIVQNTTSYDKNHDLKQTVHPKFNTLSDNEGGTFQSAPTVSTKEKLKAAQSLLKRKPVSPDRENLKNGRKNQTKRSTKPTSARPLDYQPVSAVYGNAIQGFDDSTFSETSQDEERSNSKSGNKKEKVIRQVDLADDLEDFTLSSDTATEDCDSPTSAYRNAMLLIKQLGVEGQDSVSLLKFENIVHEYERLIEKENGRYKLLLEKVKTLESERKSLQKIIEETRELKSSLEHQKVEWESDLNSVRFTLKQEEEKRKSSEMLYEKCKDQLRKKEDQCCKEMEVKQQHELNLRNMELELRTLRNSLKQVEEERSEAQRLLSQERSARAVQEGIWNKHLWKQKEEDEKTKMITKRDESLTKNEALSGYQFRSRILPLTLILAVCGLIAFKCR